MFVSAWRGEALGQGDTVVVVGRRERRQSFKKNRVLAIFQLLRVYSHMGEKRVLV